MAKKSPRRLSEHERAERRRQDRERVQQAAQELLSSEGWARWVKTRAMFHSYSAGNCMLSAAQCPAPRPGFGRSAGSPSCSGRGPTGSEPSWGADELRNALATMRRLVAVLEAGRPAHDGQH
jgi:hypothetical protein